VLQDCGCDAAEAPDEPAEGALGGLRRRKAAVPTAAVGRRTESRV